MGSPSAQSSGERLQQKHGAAFAAHIAVGARVEGFRLAILGQHAAFGESDEVIGRPREIDTARQGHVAFAALQSPHGLMERDERCGAGGVIGDARPAQIEEMRDAVGDDGEAMPVGV